MFFQDGLTGSAWGDWANYTESPLRAFENELGVQVLPTRKQTKGTSKIWSDCIRPRQNYQIFKDITRKILIHICIRIYMYIYIYLHGIGLRRTDEI